VAHTSYQLTTGNPANYGLGWGIAPFGNKTMVQHGGAIGGYRAQGIRIPEDHLYFLVMSNSGTTNSGLIGNKVISILYDVAPVKEQRNQIQNWKEIEGVYESLNSGSRLQKNYGDMKAFYTVRVDSMNRITVQRSSNASFTLTAAGKDQVYDKANPFIVWNFNRDANNKVVSFTVSPIIPITGPTRVNNRIAESVPAVKQPAKADSTKLAKYIGLYEYVLGTRTKLIIANNQLYMEDPEFGTKTQLHWLRDNIFWIKELDREVVFLTDKKGVVNALEYSNGMQMIKMSLINELY
jgi:hypothetical protein